jgi:Kef-type K+ transport system membrane component KefB
MVGAFLAGAVMDADWFDQAQMDLLRHHVLLVVMPVFFLSTGLRTQVGRGRHRGLRGRRLAAAAAAVAGKLLGAHLAGRLLGWARGEASVIGWLLQTKALIMIIFANILLDKGDHHQRHLHRAAADGRGQHHAHGAGRHAEALAGGAGVAGVEVSRRARYSASDSRRSWRSATQSTMGPKRSGGW